MQPEAGRLHSRPAVLDVAELLNSAAADECLTLFRRERLIGTKEPDDPLTEDDRRSLISDLVVPFFEVVAATGTLDPPQEAIEAAVRAYVDYDRADHEWTLLVPLLNLDAESDTVDVGSFRIEKLTLTEKSELWSPEPIIGQMLDFRHVYHTRRKLIHRGSHRGHPRQKIFTVANEVNQLVVAAKEVMTALRLTNSGAVGAPLHIHRIGAHALAGSMNEYRTNDDLAPERYVLRTTDEPMLQTIHGHLRALREASKLADLEVALRRFNLSYSRTTLEDELIDYSIALEATVLHGLREELRYRLAMRGAALLRASEPPVRVHLFLQKLYDVRSLIVHEGKRLVDAVKAKKVRLTPNDEPMAADAFMREAERLVRATLVTYLGALAAGADATLSSVNKELDVVLLNQLVPAGPTS